MKRTLFAIAMIVAAAGASAEQRTEITVSGTVLQFQAGSDNSQRARIGVIH